MNNLNTLLYYTILIINILMKTLKNLLLRPKLDIFDGNSQILNVQVHIRSLAGMFLSFDCL